MTNQRDTKFDAAPAFAGAGKRLTSADSKPKGKRGGARGERPSPSRDAIQAVIERAGQAGASQAEIRAATGFRQTACWSLIHVNAKAGVWHAGGVHGSKRYFARRDWAEAFDAEQRALALKRASAKQPALQAPKSNARNPRPWKSELPGVITPAPRGPVEIKGMDTAPRETGPSLGYDPRYQLDPTKKVHGDFSKLGIGRYLQEA